MDSSTSCHWTCPYPIDEESGKFFIISIFIEIPVFYANSVDPDQTLRSAAFDLGLYCLPMSLLRNARHS